MVNGKGLICIPSGNHDMERLSYFVHGDELKIAFAFILSMPSAPFIYYSDEIGMRYLKGITSVKGGYDRTGALLVAIPAGIFLVLTFFAPKGITGTALMIYLVTVAGAWSLCTNFGDCVNKVAIVMTPNMKERDTVMSFRGIVQAVGNSAPLVVELVIAFMVKDKGLRYFCVASLCGVVGIATILLA